MFGLAGFLARLVSITGSSNLIAPPVPYRGGTRERHGKGLSSGKEEFRDFYPGLSLDLYRYSRKYRPVGIRDQKHPFGKKAKHY